MKTNWDIKHPAPKKKGGSVRKTLRWLKSFIFNTNVPLCHSDHYNRDHFHK